MYSNLVQWKRIRKRVIVLGQSKRSTARKEGISRKTLRKMLDHESPPGYGGVKLSTPGNVVAPVELTRTSTKSERVRQLWMDSLYNLERGERIELHQKLDDEHLCFLLSALGGKYRRRSLVILANACGFTVRSISINLGVDRKTVRAYIELFSKGGSQSLFRRERRSPRKADDESFKTALFALASRATFSCPDSIVQLGVWLICGQLSSRGATPRALRSSEKRYGKPDTDGDPLRLY